MPSIQSLKSVTEPVVVQRGNLSITLYARLEKVNAKDAVYAALAQEDLDLQIKIRDERQSLERQALDVSNLVEPAPPAFVRFRQGIERSFEAAREALLLPEGEKREAALGEALGQAMALTSEFDQKTVPDDKTIKKREAAFQKKFEEGEARVKALAEQLRVARARRLIFLLSPPEDEGEAKGEAKSEAKAQAPWDLTDGEGDEPWPLTEENLLSLSPDLTKQMLEAVEKKVVGFSPLTMSSIG